MRAAGGGAPSRARVVASVFVNRCSSARTRTTRVSAHTRRGRRAPCGAGRRCTAAANGRGDVPSRHRDQHVGRRPGDFRHPLRRIPSGTFPGRGDRGRQAPQSRAARHCDFRREGLSAAHDHPPRVEISVSQCGSRPPTGARGTGSRSRPHRISTMATRHRASSIARSITRARLMGARRHHLMKSRSRVVFAPSGSRTTSRYAPPGRSIGRRDARSVWWCWRRRGCAVHGS